MVDQLKWVPCSGGYIPDNAIQGGHEGNDDPLYVARAWHTNHAGQSYWSPGKAGNSLGGCHTGSDGVENHYGEYQVLTIPPDAEVILTWESHKAGNVPENAFLVDYWRKQYVGRHPHCGTLTPGRVDAFDRGVYITCDWKDHYYNDYEILVVKNARPNEYVMEKVNYNLSGIQICESDQPVLIASKPVKNTTYNEMEIPVNVNYNNNISHKWNNAVAMTNGIASSITTGLPDIASTTVTISPEVSRNFSWGETIAESIVSALSTTVTLKPNTSAMVYVYAIQRTVEIPYTVNLTKVMPDGRRQSINTTGKYKGIAHINFHTIKDVPCLG